MAVNKFLPRVSCCVVYDDVLGNNDDSTCNLQLSKARAKETYNCLMDTLPQLKSAPYIIKGSGNKGNYVHIKFE